jgi:hydroxyethylthiazole kinase-like sugar kinase family protein
MDAETVATITGAVDYAAIITGIGTVATAVIAVLVAIKGAKMLLSMVRGA